MSVYSIENDRLLHDYSAKIDTFAWGMNLAKCPHCDSIIDICEWEGEYTEEWPRTFEYENRETGEIEYYCPDCRCELPHHPEPYTMDDYFHDHAPTVEYITDTFGEYQGAIVHHELPDYGEDGPHIWTDTRSRVLRTYIEINGEIEWTPTNCNALDEYCRSAFEDMRRGAAPLQ